MRHIFHSHAAQPLDTHLPLVLLRAAAAASGDTKSTKAQCEPASSVSPLSLPKRPKTSRRSASRTWRHIGGPPVFSSFSHTYQFDVCTTHLEKRPCMLTHLRPDPAHPQRAAAATRTVELRQRVLHHGGGRGAVVQDGAAARPTVGFQQGALTTQ